MVAHTLCGGPIQVSVMKSTLALVAAVALLGGCYVYDDPYYYGVPTPPAGVSVLLLPRWRRVLGAGRPLLLPAPLSVSADACAECDAAAQTQHFAKTARGCRQPTVC